MAKKVRQVRAKQQTARATSAATSSATQGTRPTYSSKGNSNYAQFAYNVTERAILRNITQGESFAELVEEQDWEEPQQELTRTPRRGTRHFDVKAVQRELRAHLELERSLNQLQHGRIQGATHARTLSELATQTTTSSISTQVKQARDVEVAQGQTWEFGDQEVCGNADYEAAWEAYEAQQQEQYQAELEKAFVAHDAELSASAADSSFATLFAQDSKQTTTSDFVPLTQTRPTPHKKLKGYVFNKKQREGAQTTASNSQEPNSASNQAVSSQTTVASYDYQGKAQDEDFVSLFASVKVEQNQQDSFAAVAKVSSSLESNTVRAATRTKARIVDNTMSSSATREPLSDFERYFVTGSYDKDGTYSDYRNSGKDEVATRRNKGVPTYVAGASKKQHSIGAGNLRTLAQAERELTTHKWRNESFEALYRAYDTTPSSDYQEQVARDGRGYAKVSVTEVTARQIPSTTKKKRKFLTATPSAARTTGVTSAETRGKIDWFDAQQVEKYREPRDKTSSYIYGVTNQNSSSAAFEPERELSFAELFEANRTATGKKVYVSAQMEQAPAHSAQRETEALEQRVTSRQLESEKQLVIPNRVTSTRRASQQVRASTQQLSDFERAWYAETAEVAPRATNSVAAQLAQEARQAQHQQRQELGIMSRKEQLELELAREASLIKFASGAQFISDINMRFDESNYMHANFFAEGYPAYIFEHLKQGNLNVDLEIDLHGCSRDEVKAIINKAITSALSHHESILYFMTGHGRDILKQALPNYLIQHSHVCAFVPRVDGTGQTNGFMVLLKNFSKEFFNH